MEDNYKIIIEKHAQDDLTSIYNYISNSLSNKQAADNLLVKVLEKFKMIQIFPKSAPLMNNEYVKNKLLRKLIIENYIAFYEVNEENREVRIIRIIYGMMDYHDIL